jgi:hypothetical protein
MQISDKEVIMKNGDIMPLEIMVRREEWNNGVSLYMRQVIVGMGETIAQPLEFKQRSSRMSAEPFIKLEIQEAQQLMDELWQCGLRPSKGTGSAGSLRATEKHLDDMRKIVSKNLDVELK